MNENKLFLSLKFLERNKGQGKRVLHVTKSNVTCYKVGY